MSYEEHTWDKEPEGGAGGLFLKFEDGQSIRMRFPYPGIRFLKAFEEGDPVKERFGTLVLVRRIRDGESLSEVKAFEFGASIAKALSALAKNEDWGDLSEYDVTVTRRGSGLGTKYTVVPSPKKPIAEKHLALLKEFGKLPADIFNDAVVAGTNASAGRDEYDEFAD
jgi:hypothetical protein